MFDIFAAVFDRTLLVMKFTPETPGAIGEIVLAIFHTALRAAAIYLAIRVVITAVSHGSF